MLEVRHPGIARRLNFACDLMGIPGHNEGRQAYLAEAMDCSPEGARKWLRGATRPSQGVIVKLAKFLDCDISWLEYGDGERQDEMRRVARHDVEAATYHVWASLVLIDISAIVCEPDEGQDITVLHKSRQYRFDVIPSRRSKSGHFVHVPNNVRDDTKVVIVFPHTVFGRIELLVLTRAEIAKHGRVKGGFTVIHLRRDRATWILGEGKTNLMLLSARFRVSDLFK